MTKNPYFRFTAVAMCAAVLAGCSSPVLQKKVETIVTEVQPAIATGPVTLPLTGRVLGSSAMLESLAQQQAAPLVARRATKPWYGATMVAVQSDEQLPPVFAERFTFDFDDRASGGRVPLEVVAERIYRITNVPVRISSDVQTRSATPTPASSAMVAMNIPLPGSSTSRPGQPLTMTQPGPLPAPFANASSNPSTNLSASSLPSSDIVKTSLPVTDLNSIEMRWKDRDMTSFLNTITDRLGLGWSYRDGVVMIYKYTTETFELASFGSSQDYSMSISGSSAGTSGSSGGAAGGSAAQLQVTESGKNDAVQSFVKTLTTMLAATPGSTVTLSDGTARLTVTTTKDAMRRVRSVVKEELASMTRQVAIQIDIYSLSSTSKSESGVNLALAFRNLSKTFGLTLTGPSSLVSPEAGSVSTNILTAAGGGNAASRVVQQLGNSSLVIQALAQNGYSVQHQPLNLIAMNRQWARKTNLRQTGYLSETTPSTVAGAGSGAPGLKTSTITTGDRFIIQPAILDNGAVLLKFGVSLTNLLGLFDVTAGSGATLQKVQTPEVSGTDDQSTVLLKAGQVMVLTGLARIRGTSDGRSLGESLPAGVGGSSTLTQTREDFVIFVRPVIL